MKSLQQQLKIIANISNDYFSIKKTNDINKQENFLIDINSRIFWDSDDFSIPLLSENSEIDLNNIKESFDSYLYELKRIKDSLSKMINYQKINFYGKKYLFKKELGHGGNGVVYLIEDSSSHDNFAIKILRLKKTKSQNIKILQRFSDEIKVVTTKLNTNPGVLPIFKYHIQDINNQKDTLSWYIMPVAIPISKLKFKNIEETVESFFELANTLKFLHDQNITHRDIKPENLYKYNSHFVFSDFGLTDFPQKTAKTEKKEKIGPWLTIAPEMQRNPETADFKAADVYSFAKTFWILLTKDYNCFEGQYSYTSDYMNLYKYINNDNKDENKRKIYLAPLHELLFNCTSNNPEQRYTIDKVILYLKKWLDFTKDHRKGDAYEWLFLQNQLFLYPVNFSKWDTRNNIYYVLKTVTKTPYLNHTFFPGKGGLTLNNVSPYLNDFIEFDFGMPYIGKPKLLEFHSFKNPLFNYFYLEMNDFGDLYNFTDYKNYKTFEEEVCELKKGHFEKTWYYNYKGICYNTIYVPEKARKVYLLKKGIYVIFCQSSPYNINDRFFGLDSYSAYQNRFNSSEKFHTFIETFYNEYELYKNNPSKHTLDLITFINHKKYNSIPHSLSYSSNKKKLSVRDFLLNSYFYCENTTSLSSYYLYYLQIKIDSEIYVFTKDRKFILYDNSFSLFDALEKMQELDKIEKSILLFSNEKEVYTLIRNIKKILHHHFKKSFIMPDFYLCGKFLSIPQKRFFSITDLRNAFKNGSDLCTSRLAIKPDMTVSMLDIRKINDGTRGLYFYIDTEYYEAHSNLCGKIHIRNDYLLQIYRELLLRILMYFKKSFNKDDGSDDYVKKIKQLKQDLMSL